MKKAFALIAVLAAMPALASAQDKKTDEKYLTIDTNSIQVVELDPIANEG